MSSSTQDLPNSLKDCLANIEVLALDVDGVLTDGSITYDSSGNEAKSFNIKDGLGIKLVQQAGVEVIIITGRVSPMVERRALELGILELVQGREDKSVALQEFSAAKNVALKHIAYMGDDLPDYRAICLAGCGATVADAHPEILTAADWVSSLGGGKGAVREFCDLILASKGLYEKLLQNYR